MDEARILIEVVAGLIPNQPMAEYTKQWAITSEEWHKANDAEPVATTPELGVLLATRAAQAEGYAMLLMLQSDRVNWVRMDWIYL